MKATIDISRLTASSHTPPSPPISINPDIDLMKIPLRSQGLAIGDLDNLALRSGGNRGEAGKGRRATSEGAACIARRMTSEEKPEILRRHFQGMKA